MDWSSLPFAIDLSHHNTVVDWGRVAAQKPACVFLKATERKWVDPAFDAARKACEARGLLWIPYVFLRPDDDDTTIDFFCRTLGNGDVPVALDWEAPGVPSQVVEDWIDGMENLNLVYYGLYPPAAATAKIGEWPRWFPQYPGSPTAGPRLPMWEGDAPPDWRKRWLFWQWSEKGAMAGISGNVDLNRLAVSAERFGAWCKTGEWPEKET